MPESWVIELCRDWCRQYHGLAPIKQVGKHLKPLFDTLPFSQLQIEWRHYLAATPAQFVSIPRFALTHGSWGPPSRSPVFTPYQAVSKTVVETVGQRSRLIQVDINDPRPAA